MSDEKKCHKCGHFKQIKAFRLRHYRLEDGTVSECRDNTCSSCCGRRMDPEKRRSYLRKYMTEGRRVAYVIKGGAVVSDRAAGRDNDLDLEFIRSLIALPCSYCLRKTDRMSIDRIDNAIGHIKTNVVPACRRCNSIRNSMPIEAWLVVVQGIRIATESGSFGDWEGPWG